MINSPHRHHLKVSSHALPFTDRRFLELWLPIRDLRPLIADVMDMLERCRVMDMVGEIMAVLETHHLAWASINQDGDGGLCLSVAKAEDDDTQSTGDLDFQVDQRLIDSLN